MAAVQLGPKIVHLAFFNLNLVKEEKIDIQFKGLATSKVCLCVYKKNFVLLFNLFEKLKQKKNHVIVWNGKQVRIFEMILNNAAKDLEDKITREERGNVKKKLICKYGCSYVYHICNF